MAESIVTDIAREKMLKAREWHLEMVRRMPLAV